MVRALRCALALVLLACEERPAADGGLDLTPPYRGDLSGADLTGEDLRPAPLGEVQVGTIDILQHGDARWVDIVDGMDSPLAPGAQGGFHLWSRLRIGKFDGTARVQRIADRLKDGKRDRILTSSAQTFVVTQPADGKPWEAPDPTPNFMCPVPVCTGIVDQIIELQVRVEREDGALVGAQTVHLRARCPSDGNREFCERICKADPTPGACPPGSS